MFKNEFQGGHYFEIFNPSTKDPTGNLKVVGSHGIQKVILLLFNFFKSRFRVLFPIFFRSMIKK